MRLLVAVRSCTRPLAPAAGRRRCTGVSARRRFKGNAGASAPARAAGGRWLRDGARAEFVLLGLTEAQIGRCLQRYPSIASLSSDTLRSRLAALSAGTGITEPATLGTAVRLIVESELPAPRRACVC